jgi:hypothetical protein
VQFATSSPEPEPPVPLPASKVLAPEHAVWLAPQRPKPQQTGLAPAQHVPSLQVVEPAGQEACDGITVPPAPELEAEPLEAEPLEAEPLEAVPLDAEPLAPELLDPVAPELEVLVAPLDVLEVVDAAHAPSLEPQSRSGQQMP